MKKALGYILLLISLESCFLFTGGGPGPKPVPDPDPLPQFLETPALYPIQKGLIDEASGMVASTTMPGNLWVEQDGNTSSAIHLLSASGQYLGKIDTWAYNRDWEDMADGPGPEEGVNYLYLGDIGDNSQNSEIYSVFRFKEPTSLNENYPAHEEIRFRYADQPSGWDAEAMFVDPLTKDIYIITKRQLFSVRVYRLVYPYSPITENTAEFLGTIPLSSITAADISADGQQIILKNYDAAYYWRLRKDESIYEALKRTRDIGLPYYVETQGEAICFDYKEEGYYTLSERPYNTEPVNLQYYQRKTTDQ